MAQVFQLLFDIDSGSDSQMATDMNWVKDNYSSEVHNSSGRSLTKRFKGRLDFTSFSDLVSAITAFKTQFTTSLITYDWESHEAET